MNNLTIKDETTAGQILNEITLRFENEYITVKELIEARIKSEIEHYENNIKSYKNGLVRPNDLEKRLNNKKRKVIDLEKQLYIAFEAFQKNGFFIIVDDEQVENLEDRFLVDETTHVSFIKLTQLVGG